MSTDEFEMFDASYVLCALSLTDRQHFEEHLETCEGCIRRVAQLWDLPAMLALAAPEDFTAGAVSSLSPYTAGQRYAPADEGEANYPPLPVTLLPRLLRNTRDGRRLGRSLGVLAAATAAACLAVLAFVTVGRTNHDPTHIPSQAVALSSVSGTAPLTAAVQVVQHDKWDQVNLWCTYAASAPFKGQYQAVAYAASGRSAVVGVWPGIPGQTAVIRVPTTFRAGEIESIAIVNDAGVTVSRTDV